MCNSKLGNPVRSGCSAANELAVHTGLKVYCLPRIPPLPPLRKRGAPDAYERYEPHRQGIEHVWFAICGKRPEREGGQCVLITSAVGGEGKTTLAAMLASRCGRLGMSTLLIDADLRRTSLCALIEIPDGPGLSDALHDDEPDPTDLIIPAQGGVFDVGVFDVLRAGTPVQEPCRVLSNRNLGSMIAGFRQHYELVIIDTPPDPPSPRCHDRGPMGRLRDSDRPTGFQPCPSDRLGPGSTGRRGNHCPGDRPGRYAAQPNILTQATKRFGKAAEMLGPARRSCNAGTARRSSRLRSECDLPTSRWHRSDTPSRR